MTVVALIRKYKSQFTVEIEMIKIARINEYLLNLHNFSQFFKSYIISIMIFSTLFMQEYSFSVVSCDDLSCEENEICVEAGDTFECACHPDYEGDDCEDIGWFDL